MDVIAVPIIFGFFVYWKVFKGREMGGWVRLAETDLVTRRKDNLAKALASQLDFMAENSSPFLLRENYKYSPQISCICKFIHAFFEIANLNLFIWRN
jgi:hypothetical protein